MLSHQQIFQDLKENVKSSAPVKTNIQSRKGLASRNVNSVTDCTNVIESKKKIPLESVNNSCLKKNSEKVESSKFKMNVRASKVDSPDGDDIWPDIEEMHTCNEPDDDYEDILPQSERIQKAHIDSLFFNFTYTDFCELTVDKLPSPLKETKSFDFPEFSPIFNIEDGLFDDTELNLIPLSNDLFIS